MENTSSDLVNSKPRPRLTLGRNILIAGFVAISLGTAGLIFRLQVLAVLKFIGNKHGICTFSASYLAAGSTANQLQRSAFLIAKSSKLQRGPDGLDQWETPDGQWWVPSGTRDAFLYDLAEQDRDIYRTSDGIKPGDVVLDCGANVGVFVKKSLSRGAARVIAIEPAAENLAALRKNFPSEITSGRVTIYAKGVWDKDDVLTMNIDPTNSAADSFVGRRPGSHQVLLPLTTVDQIVAEFQLNRVDFIKMDIEGAERHALRGARATIGRFHPRMALCVYHLEDDPSVIPELVHSINPNYEMACACIHTRYNIAPEVAHFRPR